MVISETVIETLLKEARPSEHALRDILRKAGEAKGLSLEEAAILLKAEDPAMARLIHAKAAEVKDRVFGGRVVLFAPLYLSNLCSNACLYCGFSSINASVKRKALSIAEVVREAGALSDMGFKRVLLVTGEDPVHGPDYIVSAVRAIYEKTSMRIVHVNGPPMDEDSFRVLKASGAGVYQSFQETYHRETYGRMHPRGKKRDFDYRITTMDRAIRGGFDDVGIGPLFGLYDHRFECLSAIAHSGYLYNTYGTHSHTISIPRLRPAQGAVLKEVPHPVTDGDIKRVVAVLRLSVPSAGVVVSTRESAELRRELLHAGASQLSAASRTNPGGYSSGEDTLEQFSTNDHRPLTEVMRSIAEEGFMPSLCTSCYRSKRTGHEFTEKTLSGSMERVCQANAILTLKEYLRGYSGNGVREPLEKALQREIEKIKDPAMKKAVLEKLKELESGKDDVHF